jgi:hypothetical protein
MARGALLLFLLAASGSARLPGLTVPQVWKQHVALDGQVIRVSGVVVKCQLLGCALRENPSANARSLGLGSSDAFDRAIQSRLGLPVVVEGRLDATCLHGRADRLAGAHGATEYVCLDRSAELAHPRIVSPR